MKKLLASSTMVLAAAAALAVGGTGAFFSDTETSTGNTFTAGAIDLMIDNTSYRSNENHVPAPSPNTTWTIDNLQNSIGDTIHKFFDFSDLKPADFGEDTISLHAGTNSAYLCANVKLTSNKDNDCTEPEQGAQGENGACGTGDPNSNGELAQQVNFIWWADDGDNVLETGENVLPGGPLGALPVGQSAFVTLADSVSNIWNPGNAPGPIPANATKYIGKAWCFGTITPAPLPNDASTGPDVRGPGFTCTDPGINNASQTDSLTADVSFSAVQSRNNPGFKCPTGNCTFNADANLVTDGGFELPLVTDLGNKWDIFPSPAAGWNILWRDPAPVAPSPRPAIANLELHRGVLGVAFEGAQYAELDSDWDGHANTFNGEPAATVIYQDIPTQIGAHYSLTYRFAPRPGTGTSDNNLESRLGGQLINATGPTAGGGSNLVVGDWILKGPFDFVATTTTTRLQFTDLGSTNNSLGTFIDDVQLKQTTCVQ